MASSSFNHSQPEALYGAPDLLKVYEYTERSHGQLNTRTDKFVKTDIRTHAHTQRKGNGESVRFTQAGNVPAL